MAGFFHQCKVHCWKGEGLNCMPKQEDSKVNVRLMHL